MTRDLQSFQFRVQVPEQVAWLKRRADIGWKDEAVLSPVIADEDLFLLLPITMGEHSFDCESRQWNRPLAVALGLGELELATDPLKGALHTQSSLAIIEVGP